ncbi:Inner membrane protein YpjD [Andreprevotia sp. IGB-42]|uniref:cytochrome C assembly family protein n=1 Tax=Andreprevotia sp. IGB-42 TaxID=2497473 RepID=UPI001358DB3E|nr:cytochrome c biogenesis protein CcsA [Andreprevotia sp. IGB-42]KAF0811887.1 Inner membrane protein YpjD [Andreprevotia sp. IGB-42]
MTWLAPIALVLYLALGWQFYRSRLSRRAPAYPSVEHTLLTLALALHGLALWPGFIALPLHFGAAEALSLTAWLAMLVYLVGHLAYQLEGIQPALLGMVALLLAASIVLPQGHALGYPQNIVSRLHFFSAMLAYAVLAIATGVAVLIRMADRRLHKAAANLLVQTLPPLLALERLLFACVYAGFALLSVALITGTFYAEHIYGPHRGLWHKAIFSALAWLAYGGLIFGRVRSGWRGQRAANWALAGFALLLLGYIGTRLVLDAILQRP